MLINDLKDENFDQELFLVFQPIIDVLTGRMMAAESLVRWHHPVYGLVPTQQWIAYAEEKGQIVSVTKWITKKIVHVLSSTLPSVSLTMNISPLCLNEDYCSFLKEEFKNLNPSQLILEITETAPFMHVQNFFKLVNNLHHYGFRVALDDFGSGYSTMKYLVDLDLDFVKIDKEFMQRSLHHSTALLILKTLMGLGREMGASVIMEGVESLEQTQLSCQLGAQYIQGYFLSTPLSLEDLQHWLRPQEKIWVPILRNCVKAF